MSDGLIGDAEVLYRRIPPGESWFEPPDRISSGNFKLQGDELGISVYRAITIDVASLLNDARAKPGSRVAETTAGQIRAARDSKDNSLGLEVVAVNDEDDPGHAEIRGSVLHERAKPAAKALRDLFKLTAPPPEKS